MKIYHCLSSYTHSLLFCLLFLTSTAFSLHQWLWRLIKTRPSPFSADDLQRKQSISVMRRPQGSQFLVMHVHCNCQLCAQLHCKHCLLLVSILWARTGISPRVQLYCSRALTARPKESASRKHNHARPQCCCHETMPTFPGTTEQKRCKNHQVSPPVDAFAFICVVMTVNQDPLTMRNPLEQHVKPAGVWSRS